MDELNKILFWIARCAVLTVGGAGGLIKIVKGKSDENPRDFTEGVAMLVVAAFIFGATFAVQKLF
ncbi:hypothetical protein [Ruminococcus sp. XPD3002]|uniref:hypothetical protein n=1 Tax=Ruminococcus sp. XPD3002 TaxID=1452269 RepID=UPI00091C3179|nr:hypothetical protein SAMN04487832_1317 [Ruminococcus flavefaciens]